MAICRLLAKQHIPELLRSVDNFFFDCDGVLWNGNDAIHKSKEVITKLKQLGKRVFLLSNNSSRTRSDYGEKCARMDFPVTEDEIASSGYASAVYLHNLGFKGKVYLLGNTSFQSELNAFGIRNIGLGPDPLLTDSEPWRSLDLDDEVKCVLVGFDPHISYMKVMKAATYIKKRQCMFLATNEDSYLPMDIDILIPGTGTIVAPIKRAVGFEPTLIGKPTTVMIDMMVRTHSLDRARSFMVGDSLATDIAMANRCGIQSLLVHTGTSRIEEVQEYTDNPTIDNSHLIPTFYADSVADLYNLIADL